MSTSVWTSARTVRTSSASARASRPRGALGEHLPEERGQGPFDLGLGGWRADRRRPQQLLEAAYQGRCAAVGGEGEVTDRAEQVQVVVVQLPP
jgi:hypothetical protein